MRYNKRYAIIKYGFNEQPVSLTKEQIPTLEEIADCDYKNIRVLDFTDVEHSMRFNPMQHRYIPTIQDALYVADNIYCFPPYLGNRSRTKATNDFWDVSARNFMAMLIHFFVNYKKLPYTVDGGCLVPEYKTDYVTQQAKLTGYVFDDMGNPVEPAYWLGKYSDMPHIIEFLKHDVQEIFEVLSTFPEIYSYLRPFKCAFDWRSCDMLVGIMASFEIILSRLDNKENYWVLHRDGDDFKIDNENLNYVIISSDKRHQGLDSITASLFPESPKLEWMDYDCLNETMSYVDDKIFYKFEPMSRKDFILQKNYEQVQKDIDDMFADILSNTEIRKKR